MFLKDLEIRIYQCYRASELAARPPLELLQNSILFLLNFFFHILDFRLKSLFLALSIINVVCYPSHGKCIHSLTQSLNRLLRVIAI